MSADVTLHPALADEAPPRSDGGRVRLTSIGGALAAAVVVVSFFLPWIGVAPEQAARFRERLQERLEDPLRSLPSGVAVEDWRRLADLAAEQGRVSGIDIFYWARTARGTAVAFDASASAPSLASRVILVLAVALAALPIVALLLALYFIGNRLRRAGSLILIFALLAGLVAVAIPAVYSIVNPALGLETTAERGLVLLLPAGAVLVLTGIFGVRIGNWWRVLSGALILGGGVVLFAWVYVASAP